MTAVLPHNNCVAVSLSLENSVLPLKATAAPSRSKRRVELQIEEVLFKRKGSEIERLMNVFCSS